MEICERRRRERSKGGFSFESPFLHSSYKNFFQVFFFQRNCWFMGTNMKGIKGFYKGITNMFVVKERELEIGYPTDVKHVAHIGWDGQADNNAPTWMKGFKTSADFSALNVGELGVGEGGGVSLSGRDFQQPMRSSDVHNESSSVKSMKKYKRKKIKSETSSPRSSSTRSSRTKTKFTKAFVEMESATTV